MSKLDEVIAARKAESPRFAAAFDRAWHEIDATNKFMSAIADILEQRGPGESRACAAPTSRSCD